MTTARTASSPLWQDIRSLPFAFWVLFTFIHRLGLFVYPFLTILLGKRGQAAEVGFVLGGYGAGALVACLWGGWWADRFGRKACIVLGSLLNGAAVLGIGYVEQVPALVSLTCVAGFANSFANPAMAAFIADVVPESLRLRAFAAYRLALNAGFCGAMALGGWLVTQAPLALFWGDALSTWAFAALALALLPNLTPPATEESTSWRHAFVAMRNLRGFGYILGVELALTAIWSQFATSLARHIELAGLQWHAYGPDKVFAAVMGINGGVIMLAELWLTKWTQRFAMRRVLITGLLLQGFGCFAYAFPGGIPTTALAMLVFTLGEMIFAPMHSTFLAQVIPADLRGRTQGLLQSIQCLFRIVAPGLGLWALHHSPWLLWGAVLLASFLGAACVWRALREASAPIEQF
jgi:MFS family permease